MARPRIDLGTAGPLLDIASYARRGPAERAHLGQDEIQLLSRTVRRTPEVMVKVLPLMLPVAVLLASMVKTTGLPEAPPVADRETIKDVPLKMTGELGWLKLMVCEA